MLEAKLLNAIIYSLITVAAFFNAALSVDNNKSFLENATVILTHSFQKTENPCSTPITYTIGTFDDRFGLSQEEFRSAIDESAAAWNDASNKSLLVYAPDGSLKVNLMYDERQEDTQKLKKIDPVIDKMETSINALDEEFKVKKKQYDEHKLRIIALKSDEELYKKESATLEAEKIAAKKIIAQRDLLYKKYEDAVAHYNALSVSRRGEDFFIGRYYRTNGGEQLDVYEFYSKQQLKRILAHELGHALGLEHASNPEDIMYELNKTTNEKPTVGDIIALGRLCGEGNTTR